MIRMMELEDILDVMDLYELLHQESDWARWEMSEEKTYDVLRNCVESPDMWGMVAEFDGVIGGFMIGYATEHWLSPDKFAGDLTLYLATEYRGSSAAIKMLKAFEKWAFEEQEVKYIDLGVSTGIHAEATAAMYGRLGYENQGISMRKLSYV